MWDAHPRPVPASCDTLLGFREGTSRSEGELEDHVHWRQCPKLSIYSVHTTGAEGHRIVHPANFLCA